MSDELIIYGKYDSPNFFDQAYDFWPNLKYGNIFENIGIGSCSNQVYDGDMFISYTVEGGYTKNIFLINKTYSSALFNSKSLKFESHNLSNGRKYTLYLDDVVLLDEEIHQYPFDLGYIEGNLIIKGCDNTSLNFEVNVFKTKTNRLIGTFPVVDGYYKIEQLDCNFEYDLIMIDKDKFFEQKVLSHRKPKPYIVPTNDDVRYDLEYHRDRANINFTRVGHYDLYVFRSTEPEFQVQLHSPYAVVDKSKNEYIDGNVEYGQTYYYKFAFVNVAGDELVSESYEVNCVEPIYVEYVSGNKDNISLTVTNRSVNLNDFTYKLYTSYHHIDINELPDDPIDLSVENGLMNINTNKYGVYYCLLESDYMGSKSYSVELKIDNGLNFIFESSDEAATNPINIVFGDNQ